MKKLFLYVIGSLIILPVYSQHLIKGTIIDSENAVMPMVNVAFLNQADSTLVTGAVSDSCGVYSTSLAGGNYIIRYSYLGYETLYRNILRSYKIRADFICEVSPFSLDFSRQTIKSNHGQKYTF